MPRSLGPIALLITTAFAVACEESPGEPPPPVLTPTEAPPVAPAPEPPPPMNRALPCPRDRVEDVARAARIRERLRYTASGARLIEELGEREVRMCFGPSNHRFALGWRLMLPMDAADEELAPEVGRLVDELVFGSAIPAVVGSDADCDSLVERAMTRQAEMFAVEAQLRVELQLPPERYGFEPDFREASADSRRDVVLAYISRAASVPGDPPAMRARFEEHCRRAREAAE